MLYVAAFGCFILAFEYLDRYFRDIWSSTFKASYPWLFVSHNVPHLSWPSTGFTSMGNNTQTGRFLEDRLDNGSNSWPSSSFLRIGSNYLGTAFRAINNAISSNNDITLMTLHRGIVKVAGILFGSVLITSNKRIKMLRITSGQVRNFL